MIERTVFTKIPAFRLYLDTIRTPHTNKQLAPGTIEKYMSCVSSFYKSFYIEVPKQPRSKTKVKPVKENMKRASKDDIRQAQEVCNLRDNAIMLSGVSSGMGASEIASLTLEAFKEGYDKDTEITTFDMRRGKVEKDFITFISPEATRAVIKYLEWRDRPPARPDNTRDVTEYEKRRTTTDSFLFVTSKVPPAYLITHDEYIRKCKSDTIIRIYNRMSCNANMCAPKGVYNPVRSHNMRKFFVTNLKNNGCDGDLIEYFVGHTLSGSKNDYYEGNPDELKEIYKQFIPYITIRKDIDVSESPEYQTIKKENVILQAETARHVVERSELADLRKQIDEMNRDNDIIKEVLKRVNLTDILE